ncbi:MAG: hypothetical protein IT435_08360 [Phycisphaerales bacterium]|nr:hypothetical protein [Phycisphaerales bacterium]
MAILRAVLAAAVMAVGSCLASARSVDVVPDPEGGPAITDLKKVGNNWELRDVSNNKLLMQQRNAVPLVQVVDNRVTYAIQFNEQPTGFDMVVTFTNPTSDTLPIGTLYAGMFTLGADIQYLDVRHTSVWRSANFTTFIGKGYTYPDDFYSPVCVFRNGDYSIGLSLRYPAVEWNHDTRVLFMNPTGGNSGEGGPGWATGFRLSNPNNVPPSQKITHPGYLQPHTSRKYVLTCRVTRDRDNWMQTLLPYRQYFRALYGGVSYERLTQPILPVGIADSYYQEAGNLDGFGDGNTRRPDVFGWGPWADELCGIQGYSAVMLWAPSGLYFFNPQFNYPFQITSRWDQIPIMRDAFDPDIGLPRVGKSGKTLGLWWGRSLDVSHVWDPATVTPLDPANPTHIALAEREIDGAIRAGVTLIGMDTCNPSINGIRNTYLWIKHLRQRYVGITFIAEPSPCDILNTQLGGILPGWALDGQPTKLADCYPFQNPHYLADFLLPGHETVMSFRYNFHEDYFGYTPTPDDIDHDVRWFAEMGFVPMVWKQVGTVGDVRAAESWTWTVPGNLRLELDKGDADKTGSDGATQDTFDDQSGTDKGGDKTTDDGQKK